METSKHGRKRVMGERMAKIMPCFQTPSTMPEFGIYMTKGKMLHYYFENFPVSFYVEWPGG